MQLSHALQGQFIQGTFHLMKSKLEQVVSTNHLKKKHISSLYSHLVMGSLPEMRRLREQWQRDIPELDEEK